MNEVYNIKFNTDTVIILDLHLIAVSVVRGNGQFTVQKVISHLGIHHHLFAAWCIGYCKHYSSLSLFLLLDRWAIYC